jgi:hypothetical protein
MPGKNACRVVIEFPFLHVRVDEKTNSSKKIVSRTLRQFLGSEMMAFWTRCYERRIAKVEARQPPRARSTFRRPFCFLGRLLSPSFLGGRRISRAAPSKPTPPLGKHFPERAIDSLAGQGPLKQTPRPGWGPRCPGCHTRCWGLSRLRVACLANELLL